MKFSHWSVVDGLYGLLVCANFCSDECEEWGRSYPHDVAERLRARKSKLNTDQKPTRTCR